MRAHRRTDLYGNRTGGADDDAGDTYGSAAPGLDTFLNTFTIGPASREAAETVGGPPCAAGLRPALAKASLGACWLFRCRVLHSSSTPRLDPKRRGRLQRQPDAAPPKTQQRQIETCAGWAACSALLGTHSPFAPS